MKYETFVKVKRIIAVIFAMIVASSVVTDNWILAVVAAITIVVLSLLTRKNVKEVVNDERDYVNAGKAARMSLSIFSIIGAFLALVLMFLHYQVAGSVLAYSVCALLLIHSGFFSYYAKQN